MTYDVIIIGGGAAGLMAAYGAATALSSRKDHRKVSVAVLEKMPRPGRKIMITGKGRCNFTNMKDWSAFSTHIRSNSNVVRPAFYNLTPERLADFFRANGMESVTERGDRVFPESHKSMDVVDTLAKTCLKEGVRIETGFEVSEIGTKEDNGSKIFTVRGRNGGFFMGSRLILATGGLSYPTTGSTGDGYRFAEVFGHSIKPCFPSLTALVPKGYKLTDGLAPDGLKGHIDRSLPLSELGESLCGIQLKNVGVKLLCNGNISQEMEGDVDFTDGGIEGPAGFTISRNAVKTILNGGKVQVVLDLKAGVDTEEFASRVEKLWNEVRKDPRSAGKPIRQTVKVLLGKLMPWELVPAFIKCNPDMVSGKKGREVFKVNAAVRGVRSWVFDIEGYVGFERCVITAGGVSCDEIIPKTLASKKCSGLYICGEVLDIDADTGGYNLHLAFSTGFLAGQSAALSL